MVREQFFTTLLAVLTAPQAGVAAPWLTIGRREITWQNVKAQPALFVVDGDEEYPDTNHLRPRFIGLEAEAVILANSPPNADVAPTTVLNPLIDWVETALKPPVQFRLPQTLKLLPVVYCRIEGRILVGPGNVSGQAIARVPIKIQVAEGH